MIRAAYFIDLDGTCLHYHTQEWLPGIVDKLTALHALGHQIIFITMRDRQRDARTAWSAEGTLDLVNLLPFPHIILFNVHSPRVFIDDSPTLTYHVTTNDPASWPV